jgi:hypothetical protein
VVNRPPISGPVQLQLRLSKDHPPWPNDRLSVPQSVTCDRTLALSLDGPGSSDLNRSSEAVASPRMCELRSS